MNPRYDVFISYRRRGGLLLARCICYYLRSKGVRCFFDMKEIKEGKFDEKIYRALDNSKYFLLILTDGSLDRCAEEGDWVRKEIEYAMSIKDKNHDIVPLAIKGHDVRFSDNLPASILELETVQRTIIDEEMHFERDIEDVLVNRMQRVGKKITREFQKGAKRRQEEAEDAFREQARQFKDVDHIRIDIGGGYEKLLRFADDLDIDRSRACVLIEEVNHSINQRRRRDAWIKSHPFMVLFLVLSVLSAMGVLAYSLMPSDWRDMVDDRVVSPFVESCSRFWEGVCRTISK